MMQNNNNVKEYLKESGSYFWGKTQEKKRKKEKKKNQQKKSKTQNLKIKYLNIRNVKINILFGEGRWNKENILFIFKRLFIKNKSLK